MCNSKEKCSDAMEFKLKKYEIIYTAYADEIRNLWQRSIFLGAFMVLVWSGYGVLQLKAIEQSLQNIYAYNCASLGLCFVLIVLSLLWVAMAKGSKFVQEAHEAHINRYNTMPYLFCDLKKYQKGHYDIYETKNKDKESRCPLSAFRFSPSKINIALGWFSLLVSFVLINFHLNAIYDKTKDGLGFTEAISDYHLAGIFGVSLFATIFIAWIISFSVKSSQSKSLPCKIWQWIKSLFSKPNDNQNQINDDKKPRPIKIKIKSGIVNITPTKGAKNG